MLHYAVSPRYELARSSQAIQMRRKGSLQQYRTEAFVCRLNGKRTSREPKEPKEAWELLR